jgi:putative aldouronate transport system substrate-binding protein
MDNLQYWFQAFGGYEGIGKDANGNWYEGFFDEGTQECLVWLKKLYDEKIMDQEFTTMANAEVRNKFLSGKGASSLDYYVKWPTMNKEVRKFDPNAELSVQVTLTGPHGDVGGALNEAGQNGYALSKDSKHPQEAVDLIGFLHYSLDGVIGKVFGLRNVLWELDSNGVMQATERGTELNWKPKEWGWFNNAIPGFEAPGPIKFPPETQQWVDGTFELADRMMANLGDKYYPPVGKSKIYDRQNQALNTLRHELYVKIIMGIMSPPEAMEEFQALWNSINGDLMLQELNQ